MEKYERVEIEVVEFKAEDIISTSGSNNSCNTNSGAFDGEWVCIFGTSGK